MMTITFIDANILFSAAYREYSGLLKLWQLRHITLATSHYAIEEARRNLKEKEKLIRLEKLIEKISIIHSESNIDSIPNEIDLREKDKPILAGALLAKAHYLITGDFRDFGKFYEKKILGITILPPTKFLSLFEEI